MGSPLESETLTALFKGVASQPLRAEADGIAIIVLAHCVQAARIRHAGVGGPSRAPKQRIALVSWQALALCLVIHWQTVCIRAAIGLRARVDAKSVEAIAVLARWTVLVVVADVLAFVL